MRVRNRLRYIGVASTLPLALTLFVASPALGENRPPIFSQAQSVNEVDLNQVQQATVWLNMHNKQQLDSIVAAQQKPGSPTFHKWLTRADLARFAPTDADVATLKKELTSQGLTVISTGGHNMFVKVQGTVGSLQTAFHTQIKGLTVKGEAVRATTAQPKLEGPAGSLVMAVTGLDDLKAKPDNVRPIDPDTGKAWPAVPVASPNGLVYAGYCLRQAQAQTFKKGGVPLPIAQYVGNRYGADITNTASGTLPPCGYDASEIQTAYGLKAAYAKGLNGAGQTIVIVDAYGSATIAADANLFSEINGLPPLTSSNFQIYYPGGAPHATSPGNAAGWEDETSLDVEWAHALAPGADIALVVAPSNDFSDLEAAVLFAISNEVGSVVSNSYGANEAAALYYGDISDILLTDALSEVAASVGMSVNYSSGDNGDLVAAIGVPSVSFEGASPNSTSVGGTSLALNHNGTMMFQTGWGNNISKLATVKRAPLVPPLNEGFIYGAGGGESQFFSKPWWQSSLPGVGRQQPDVSLVADPYTGVEIIYSSGGLQYIETIGGTSLACPAFSAIWAIANQQSVKTTGYWLGQAAPIVAALGGTSAITDVTAYTSPTNVMGIIATASGSSFISADSLAAPLEGTTDYYSALYQGAVSGSWYALSFGTDSSLTVGPGWDNVTGYGTPNGLPFIQAAATYAP